MNTAINTRENDHRIAAAALLRHDPSETEGVDFLDEIATDGSIIAPAIVAAADRNGYTPAALCEDGRRSGSGERRSARLQPLGACDHQEPGRLHGEDVVITRPGRRSH